MEAHLFNERALSSVMKAHERELLEEIQAAPEDHVVQVDVDAWAIALAAKWRLDCPRLDIDGMYQDQPQPFRINVSWDRSRYFGSAPPSVAGHRTTVHLPFSGDRALFQMRPSMFTVDGTSKAEVLDDRLDMEVAYPDDSPANIGSKAHAWASKIQKHLEWMEADLAGFEDRLRRLALTSIAQRKELIVVHREHLAKTGLPTKPRGKTSEICG